jgi:hypothetical protein
VCNRRRYPRIGTGTVLFRLYGEFNGGYSTLANVDRFGHNNIASMATVFYFFFKREQHKKGQKAMEQKGTKRDIYDKIYG